MRPHPTHTALLGAAILLGLAVGGGARAANRGPEPAAPAASPSPPAAACGDGLLGPDETCASCPADCVASTCRTTGRRAATIDLAPQSGYERVGAVTILLGYRRGVFSLPGERSEPAVQARVTARQPQAQVFVNDLGYALRIVVSSQEGLPGGPILDVDLDTCAGAPAVAGDLSCRVESCAQGGAKLRNCTCAVTLP